MTPDPLDAKLIAAWQEVPEPLQGYIRIALKKPALLGAYIGAEMLRDRHFRTSLGYVVHSGWVTPLAPRIIEAIDWNEGVEAKPKRAGKAAAP